MFFCWCLFCFKWSSKKSVEYIFYWDLKSINRHHNLIRRFKSNFKPFKRPQKPLTRPEAISAILRRYIALERQRTHKLQSFVHFLFNKTDTLAFYILRDSLTSPRGPRDVTGTCNKVSNANLPVV